MTKLSRPMTSCDYANLLMMCGKLRAVEHCEHVKAPLP